jgi:hypothetical protein
MSLIAIFRFYHPILIILIGIRMVWVVRGSFEVDWVQSAIVVST